MYKNTIGKLLFIAALVSVVSCLFAFGWLLAELPQIEARECAGPCATYAMRHGEFGVLPTNIYLYGFLQPALLAIFPESIDYILLHRYFSFACCLCAALLLFPISKRIALLCGRAVPRYLGYILFCIFLIPNMADMPNNMGTPGMLGLLLSNLILLLTLIDFKGKPALLGLLIFFAWETKPYFVFSGFYIVLYYLLFSDNKKKGLLSLAIFTASAIIPFFISCTMHQQLTMLQHCAHSNGQSPLARSLKCYILYCSYILPILLMAPFLMVRYYSRYKGTFRTQLTDSSHRCLVFALSLFAIFTLIILKIGGHTGMLGFIYQAQLLTTPYCLLLAVVCILYPKMRLRYILLMQCCIILSSCRIAKKIHCYRFFERDEKVLEAAVYEDIDTGRKVSYSALTGVYEYRKGQKVSDNGQLYYLKTTYPKSGTLFQENKEQAETYISLLKSRISNAYWDVVYTDEASLITNISGTEDLLTETYIQEQSFMINMGRQNMKVVRWVRK